MTTSCTLAYEEGIQCLRQELFKALKDSGEFNSPESITDAHCKILLSHPEKFIQALAGSILRFTNCMKNQNEDRKNQNEDRKNKN